MLRGMAWTPPRARVLWILPAFSSIACAGEAPAPSAPSAPPEPHASSVAAAEPPDARALPRMDSMSMKWFRVETCFWGAGAIRAARRRYLSSLAGAAPTVQKRPGFFTFVVSGVPFDRYARACTVAAALKEPALPGVDEAVAGLHEGALELAKDLTSATKY